ncbi:MAG: reverse transcriptase domain-containing protein [Deltaproteobacteria bacterium]|nr:reverse transcriptase domain-containing protein [Deltaproteobacteria bacterium]
MLKLPEVFLKADILDGMNRWTPEGGTPQGVVISPLLANLFLHPVDREAAEAGYKMVGYADDFVLLSKSPEEAQSALATVSKLIEERGLLLHPDNTKTVDLSQPRAGFNFLGYRFTRNTVWPRKKGLAKVKDAIRMKTRRSNGHSLEAIIEDVNRTIAGWFEYFKHANARTFPRLDGWIRRRLRRILRDRQRKGGISRGYDHMLLPNKFFRERGLL